VKGEVPPVVVANTPASETHPAISPDGKWIVYSIADGESTALYVRAFPGPGRAKNLAVRQLADLGRTTAVRSSSPGRRKVRQETPSSFAPSSR